LPHANTKLKLLSCYLTPILPFAVSNAIGYGEHYSRSNDAVIRVYDDAGNVIETDEHAGDFKE
jgi:hypothetical protein